jgi:pentatricopeptide repeat domain-containing protein 1
MQLLEEVKGRGIEFSVKSYAITALYAREKQGQKDVQPFEEEAKAASIKPDGIAYSAAITACAKSGQMEKAMQLFKEMKKLK